MRASQTPLGLVRAMRPLQWAKNLLIFVPLVTSHTILRREVAWPAIVMFVAFSLATSGIYIVNDLLDVESDRKHPVKRLRPFAAGDISASTGWIVAVVLFVIGGVIVSTLSSGAIVTLATYVALAALYSLLLKRVVLLDVFTLAVLHTFRIVAGHESSHIAYSPWLLTFAFFLFLSLAWSKRVSELSGLLDRGEHFASGRGYHSGDREQLNLFGVCSGLLATLVLALYVNSSAVAPLYTRPLALWLLCPLMLYWICRVWILAARGEMDEDPIAFAVHDPQTYLIGAIGLAVMVFAARSF